MAKVLEDKSKNIYIYIYSNDHMPAHVHAFIGPKKSREAANIKINLMNVELVCVPPNLSKDKIRSVLYIVFKNREFLIKKWKQMHG